MDFLSTAVWSDAVSALSKCTTIETAFESLKTVVAAHTESSLPDRTITIALISKFIQENFVGPLTGPSDPLFDFDSATAKEAISQLELGEDVMPSVRYPGTILLARRLLQSSPPLPSSPLSSFTHDLWCLRCLFLHQRVMVVPVGALKVELLATAQRVVESAYLSELSEEDQASVLVEVAAVFVFHRHHGKADALIARAGVVLGLELSLTGVLTRRTKFQQQQKATLVLAVNQTPRKDYVAESTITFFPKDPSRRLSVVAIEDPDLLPKPEFSDSFAGQDVRLTGFEACVALLQGIAHLDGKVIELSDTESMAFFERAVLDADTFACHLVALLWRSKVYTNRPKTRETAVLQMEVLVNALEGSTEGSNVEVDPLSRQALFFAVLCPVIWDLKKQYAGMLNKLGMVKTALDIYMSLELWEEILDCCVVLGRLAQVEEIISARLEQQGPSAKLLVILGDIRKDKSLYEQAWEVSKHTYAAAKRRLGREACNDNDHNTAIEHFQAALKANMMHDETWFRLGASAAIVGDHSKAAQAFTECVRLDPTNGQAWNNLAAALLELNKLKEAHSALGQAVKYLRTHVKVWENYLTVSIKLYDFQGILVSFETLLEISKDRALDDKVLAVLVDIAEYKLKGPTDQVKGAADQPAEPDDASANRFVSRVGNAFSKLSESVSPNGLVWAQYARFKHLLGDKPQAVELQTRCCRCLDVGGWESNVPEGEKLFRALLKLSEYALEAGQKKPLFSIRSFIKSALKRGAETFAANSLYAQLEASLEQIQQLERSLKDQPDQEFKVPT